MAIIRRNKATIFGLPEELAKLTQDIAAEVQTRQTQIGDITSLTEADVVSAILALKAKSEGIVEDTLEKDQNLADVENVETARDNLAVYSRTEVDDAIELAKIALGTNFTVDDLTARDVLEDLDLQDRVFVRDNDGEGWAQYKPAVIDEETGLVTEWIPLMTEAVFKTVMTAEAIKTAYESNADTNALTDAMKAKLDALSDDQVAMLGELVTDLQGDVQDTQIPSAKAVQTYVDQKVLEGGALPFSERVIVTDNTITLTHAPRNGLFGILNFGCVRYMDADGSSWDAPVTPVAENTTQFTVNADTVGQWDGEEVTVQYLYTPSLEPIDPPVTDGDDEESTTPDV